MWARMIVAPWWVRWLVDAAVVTLALLAITAATWPTFFAVHGWLLGVAVLLGFGLAAAVPVVRVQSSVQHAYADALTGLNLEQRTQIVKALRRGEVPADPRVLAAAVRAGAVSLAYRRHAARWQNTSQWWLPVAYVVLAVASFALNSPRQALLWLGFAAFFAALFGRRSSRARRLPQRVEHLRAAAAEIAQAASAATEPAVALPPRRMKTSLLLAVVVAVGFGATMYFWGAHRQTPDCRTADTAVNFIYTHQEMLDVGRITTGEPPLGQYHDWSNQLQSYAGQVSAPDIALHLRRVADLSVKAVSLVEELRNPGGSPPPDVTADHKTAFRDTVNELVAEDGDLIPICHRRN
jgi:hypothetical protein